VLVGKLGRIRSRRGGREFFLDFRPYRRAWSNRGIRITDEETACRLLEQIRGQVAEDPAARRWTPTSLHRRWEAACRSVGLRAPISLYEGTKHTFATNAKRRGAGNRTRHGSA